MVNQDMDMIKEVFERLPEERQDRILRACMAEFIAHGYRNASTNRMVEGLGISKGILFHYFGSKEELYLYLLYRTGKSITAILAPRYRSMPKDLPGRLRTVVEGIIDCYAGDPDNYRFFTGFAESGMKDLQAKYLALFTRDEISALYADIFEGIDSSRFRYDDLTIRTAVRWIVTGMKQDIVNEPGALRDPAALKRDLTERLDAVIRVLETGIYKRRKG